MYIMKITIILFFLSITFSRCHNQSNMKDKKDYFYKDIGGLGYKRIPLIKPYEAKMVSDSEWRIELQTTNLLELSINNVKEINIIDSIIFVYSKGSVSIKSNIYPEGWFVLIPSANQEMGFDKFTDYRDYLNSKGVKNAPHLSEINKVYDKFSKDRSIIWPKE